MAIDRRWTRIAIEVEVPDLIAEHVLTAYDRPDPGDLTGWHRSYAWFVPPSRAMGTFLIVRLVYIIIAWYAFAVGRGVILGGTPVGDFVIAHGLLFGYLLFSIAELGILEWMSLMTAFFLSGLEDEVGIGDRFGLSRAVMFGGQSLFYLFYGAVAIVELTTTNSVVVFQ